MKYIITKTSKIRDSKLRITDPPLNIVSTIIKKYFHGRCLDIGCGTGRHLLLMPQNSVGLDADDKFFYLIKKRNKQHNLIKHDLNEFSYPFKKNQFDTILCSHVIEHLYSPYKTLMEIKRILKPRGILIVAIPNPKCLYSDVYSKEWINELHINVWDHYSFQKFLTIHDFKVLKRYCNHPFSSGFSAFAFNLPIIRNYMNDLWFICENRK